jgi:hypothetical protein
LKDEVNVFDLLVVECIRILLPSTYEFVYENGRYFHEPPGGIERWNRTQDFEIEEGARKKAIAAALDDYFGKLDREDRELAQTLLSRIFPSVKEYCREKSKGLGPLSISDTSEERRISDANFFSRYFEYAVPATMFGEKEMDDFIASVHDADKGAIATVLDATLPDAEPDDLRRIHFLRRLRSRVAEIPGEQARLLAVAMAERTLGMLSDHIAYQVLKGDVLALAAHFQGTPELQAVLAEVVQAAGSDMFASDIVYSSVSAREKADEITSWSGFDAEAIKKVFGTRMRSRHPKPVSNVLPSDADHPLAFSRWRVYVPEDVPYMTDYFRTAFDFSFQNLGTFLQWLLPGNVGYQGSPIKFVEGFYSPVSDIVARLKKAEQDGVKWSPEHAAAIQRFREFLDAEPESTPPTS